MTNNIIQIAFALFLTAAILSCHDPEDLIIPHNESVVVQFDSTQVKVHENEEQHFIELTLDKKPTKKGLLTLSVTSSAQSRFTFEPALSNGQINVNVIENRQTVTISLKPSNNSLADGNLEFSVSILEVSDGFVIGSKKSLSVSLVDDDTSVPVQESVANFIHSDDSVMENSAEGKSYRVGLSQALASPGSIEISLESEQAVYGVHFNTIPPATNGKIILNPAIGESHASFTVVPIDNTIIIGELKIASTITGTTGSIVKGSRLSQAINIIDDELINKPKGYESGGGGWSLKKFYEYDEQGRVKFVYVEKASPATSTHSESYFYDAYGRIQKINTYPQIDIVFTWSLNRIEKSETIDHGMVKEYVEYSYDDQGNVSGTANYFRQQDGQFKLGFTNIYLYFLDGNLYKSQTYIPTDGPEESILVSTKTFDHYIDAANPFPMVEILPTVKAQTKLPSTYTIEENEATLVYNMNYEFRDDGLVHKRTAGSGNLTETAFYWYY